MTQEHYLSQEQIKEVSPYMTSFVTKQAKAAKEDIQNSKEFLAYMEEFLSTKSYEEMLTLYSEDNIEKLVNYVEYLVDTFSEIEPYEDEDNSIKEIIMNCTLFRDKFHLWGEFYNLVHESTFTKENYLDIIEDIINDSINIRITNRQKQYAIDKMSIHDVNWLPNSVWNKLGAVLATAQCGSLDELESLIKNSFDFEAIVLGK